MTLPCHHTTEKKNVPTFVDLVVFKICRTPSANFSGLGNFCKTHINHVRVTQFTPSSWCNQCLKGRDESGQREGGGAHSRQSAPSKVKLCMRLWSYRRVLSHTWGTLLWMLSEDFMRSTGRYSASAAADHRLTSA